MQNENKSTLPNTTNAVESLRNLIDEFGIRDAIREFVLDEDERSTHHDSTLLQAFEGDGKLQISDSLMSSETTPQSKPFSEDPGATVLSIPPTRQTCAATAFPLAYGQLTCTAKSPRLDLIPSVLSAATPARNVGGTPSSKYRLAGLTCVVLVFMPLTVALHHVSTSQPRPIKVPGPKDLGQQPDRRPKSSEMVQASRGAMSGPTLHSQASYGKGPEWFDKLQFAYTQAIHTPNLNNWERVNDCALAYEAEIERSSQYQARARNIQGIALQRSGDLTRAEFMYKRALDACNDEPVRLNICVSLSGLYIGQGFSAPRGATRESKIILSKIYIGEAAAIARGYIEEPAAIKPGVRMLRYNAMCLASVQEDRKLCWSCFLEAGKCYPNWEELVKDMDGDVTLKFFNEQFNEDVKMLLFGRKKGIGDSAIVSVNTDFRQVCWEDMKPSSLDEKKETVAGMYNRDSRASRYAAISSNRNWAKCLCP